MTTNVEKKLQANVIDDVKFNLTFFISQLLSSVFPSFFQNQLAVSPHARDARG